MPKRKKADATIKKDIASAVATLPDLIAKEVYLSADAPTQTDNTSTKRVAIPSAPDTGKRRVMWLGVSLTMATVLVMWVWNARAILYDMVGKKTAESNIFNEAKSDLDTIFDSFSLQSNLAKAPTDTLSVEAKSAAPNEQDIRNALENLVATPAPETSVLGVRITSEPTSTPAFPTSGVRTTTEELEIRN